MHTQSGLRACLLAGLAVSAWAEDDPDYSPLDNFHPRNVTGLNRFYSWVGSYYNGTTELKLTPETGSSAWLPLCENLTNYTSITTWDSVLSIAERGTYNNGSNLINMVLNMFPPDFSWPNSTWLMDDTYWGTLQWPLFSAKPQFNNRTTVYDSFNMTLAKNSSAFDLSGLVHSSWAWKHDSTEILTNFSMPACNSTTQTGDYRILLETGIWYNTHNWSDFRFPQMNASFDDHTANLTLTGKFSSEVYLKRKYLESPVVSQAALGSFELHFSGSLDELHSDVLDMNSSSPTWLRTVGFGNNSLNVDNDAKNAAGLARVTSGSTFIIVLYLILGMFLGV